MKIKNKKTFIRAILIIALTIATIILAHQFFAGLRINGLDSLFTCNAYRQAFEQQLEIDNYILVGFEIVTSLFIIVECIAQLSYYSKIDLLEREVKEYGIC